MRKALLGGTAAVAVLGIAAVAAVGFGGGGEPAAPVAGGQPPATAKVTKATLTQTEQVTGTLSYGVPKSLPAKGQGTITWLPPEGSIIKLGGTVYQVDLAPVVLINGTVPPYRTLESGVEGPDVTQFEQSLKKLGYPGFTVDDKYTWATAAAVEKWQDDLGVAETGKVEPTRIAVAPGDIRIALHVLQVGDAVGKEVLTYTGTTRVVTIALDVSKQQLVKKGIQAAVALPTGKSVTGTVSAVGTVATTKTEGSGAGASATTTIGVTVSVADQKSLGTLDAAPVSVSLVSGKRENVLAVPIAALVALAEGGYGVQVVDGSRTTYVAVKTGMFAGGKVEISGAGVTEGTTVGVPST